MTHEIHHGDCLQRLKELPDNSVDAIVTDPPYGLAFMGKRWDYDVPSQEIWAECLRVLKPGGHLLAFAGTRTQHRMAVRIEDAGFEIRDMIAWVYGSGFPKSLDVSKAIDKAGGDALAWRAFSEAYAAAVAASPMTHADIDRTLGVKSSSCYWARTDHRGGMPPRHHWETVREMLALSDTFARLYDEAEREVVGHRDRGFAPGTNAVYGDYSGDTRITAPATEAAKQWQGWGTALKPALEPITVARKPLIGTVAENVLAHGTGAINVDGCRVGDTVETWPKSRSYGGGTEYAFTHTSGGVINAQPTGPIPSGRWPANLIHDGSDEVVGLFPITTSGSTKRGSIVNSKHNSQSMSGKLGGFVIDRDVIGDTGSAARFFYCAKASRKDRNEGCKGMEQKSFNPYEAAGGLSKPRENHHPTVKPTDLMRYLCRLVTPPGGVVLDPFMGSGSTGKAAMLEGFRFIGIEREAEYVEIAKARINAVVRKPLDGVNGVSQADLFRDAA